MKFETIILEKDSKPEFPLDLLFKSDTPRAKPVTTDSEGNLISVLSGDAVVDCGWCNLFDISESWVPEFMLGYFLIKIQQLGGRVEEVVAVYNHDKTKFGLIGFYYETVS